MTKDQLQELENYAFELKHNRDYYSRAKIIELLVEKVRELSESRLCCPKCGSSNYEEHEELMSENGIDDSQYGGQLKNVKYGDCRDCG